MNARNTLCLFSCMIGMALRSAFAISGPSLVLNPSTFVSPSGIYSLAIDPTDSHGQGPADYRFTKASKPVWAKRLPYTLWDATVADSGRIAGYAYMCGWNAFETSDSPGEFIVAMLSPEGKILKEERHARHWSRFLDTPPNPLASGTIFDSASERFVVRIFDPDINRRIERWWLFDLKTAKRLGTLEPGRAMPDRKSDEALFILAARAVPDTSLVLIHWWKYTDGDCGGVFTLIDLDDAKARSVWTLALDGDYSVPENEEAEDRIRNRIRAEGAILDSNKPAAFAIHAVKQSQRIDFSVKQAQDGEWQIRETARSPYQFHSPELNQEPHLFPQVALDEVAVISLGGTARRQESPIRDVCGFQFDEEGRVCVLSWREEEDLRLLRVSQQGGLLNDLRVPVPQMPETAEVRGPASIGGARCVVAVSDIEPEGKAQCFVADFDARSVKKLSQLRCPAIAAMAGFPDGRFAALTDHRMKYSGAFGLLLCDANKGPLWQKEDQGYAGKPEELLGAEDIARYGNASIAVLDNVRNVIQLFDVKGSFLRSVDLAKGWKREPNYPTHLAEDCDGGFVVYDFDAPNPLVRMDSHGGIRKECSPRFSDGLPVDVQDVQRSPDGRLWVSDGDVLLRLSDDGTVDRILGEEAASDVIYQVECVAVDPNDCVYLGDHRTKTVHVFDAAGNKVGVCVPNPADLPQEGYIAHIAASGDGQVFVAVDREDGAYLRFDRQFNPAGIVQIALDTVAQQWQFQPAGPMCWVAGYEEVFLVKNLQQVVRKISRRPDRHWLEDASSLGVAPDGSVAVLARSRSGEVSVNTYDPAGNPRTTFLGPRQWAWSAQVAYDGQTIFVVADRDLYIIGPDNRRIGVCRLPLPRPENRWDGPFLAAGGTQLWFVDRETVMLHKFTVPQFDQPSDAGASHGGSTKP